MRLYRCRLDIRACHPATEIRVTEVSQEGFPRPALCLQRAGSICGAAGALARALHAWHGALDHRRSGERQIMAQCLISETEQEPTKRLPPVAANLVVTVPG